MSCRRRSTIRRRVVGGGRQEPDDRHRASDGDPEPVQGDQIFVIADRSFTCAAAGVERGALGVERIRRPPAALEQVRARVGGIDWVPHIVRKRRLDDLARMGRFLRRPIPEAWRSVRNPRSLRRALTDRAGVDGDIVPRFHAHPPPSFPRTPLDDLPDMIRLMVRHCTRSSPTGRVAGRAGIGWSSCGSPFARLLRPGWSATREAVEASSIGSRKARCESWRRCPAR